MAILLATRIILGTINPKTGLPTIFSDIPMGLKQQVADILINQYNFSELVPISYGGSLTE